MFKSIFGRLFWTYAAILALLFTSLSLSVGILADRFATSRQIDSIMKVKDTIEYWTGAMQIESNNARSQTAYKQVIKSWSDFLGSDIVITNNDGEVIAGTCNITTVPSEFAAEVLNGARVIEHSTFNGSYPEKMLVVGLPMEYQGTIVGAMYFNTAIFNVRKMAQELFFVFFISSLFSILVAAALVYMQSKRISKPIGEINRSARDIASGNFDRRVAVTSKDEIGQLASSFNFMADSIAALENNRSEFISDVAHELRTPMTSISGFVEGIMDGTIPQERQDEYLKIVLDESKRLTKMVNDMLEMSKMSSNQYKLDVTDFDLNELTRVCVISLGNKIDEKNLELDVDFADDALAVLADKDAIQRVVINLVDNAVKFSYPNTKVTIKTWTERGKAYFSVGNFGDGIDGGDLSNIFNRFYKTDKSRGSDKSGAGLGLSFVKNIMTLHEQNVWVESIDTKEGSPVKYTKFTFTLELA